MGCQILGGAKSTVSVGKDRSRRRYGRHSDSFIIHLHRISGGKKIMMKKGEGKKTK